jgi:hypothetical protein
MIAAKWLQALPLVRDSSMARVLAGSCPRQDTQNMGNWKMPGHRGFLFDLTPTGRQYG